MIIYFGNGKYAQFDTERYDDMDQCLAAKSVIVEKYEGSWTPLSEEEITCLEVRH
ncbi:hypothetical protein J3S91_07150 [Sinorhizobium meliloti]|uniref:hypothetical protein n=1 Tax=Rhizobium meliloti TaxID=382 RepID=UPI0012FDB508|nr:hypothetical protein [Sinorhizobium meliloti]MCK3783497.1 hypothetical protein [Sinorhizobium meliloti]MCK3787873.1 hypothetical protein [Sinorhizobium meliloti]MCK3794850.1 hypothetical protein [Sinorhizobium meliloti]